MARNILLLLFYNFRSQCAVQYVSNVSIRSPNTFHTESPLGVLPHEHTTSISYHTNEKCLLKDPLLAFYSVIRVPSKFYQHHNFPVYIFKLHSSLRLNLTLREVYFSLFTPHCLYGMIQLWTNQSKFRKTAESYCGVYDQVDIFPHSNAVTMSMPSKPLIVIDIKKLIYSVIDMKTVFSYRAMNVSRSLKWIVVLPQMKTHCYVYYVKVSLLKFIKLLTVDNQTAIEVFDGPGIWSPLISPIPYFNYTLLFEATTFQATLYSFPNDIAAFYLTYVSLSQSYTTSKQTGNTNMYLSSPISCFNRSICIRKLVSKQGTFFNITIHTIRTQSASNTQKCTYGGVSMIERTESHFVTLATECSKQQLVMTHRSRCFKLSNKPAAFLLHLSGVKTQEYFDKQNKNYRSYLSASNVIFLVYYAYQSYSSLEVHLTVGITTCNVIHFKLCDSIDLDCPNTKLDHFATLEDRSYFSPMCSIIQMSTWDEQKPGMCTRDLPFSCAWKKNIVHTRSLKRVSVSAMGAITGQCICFRKKNSIKKEPPNSKAKRHVRSLWQEYNPYCCQRHINLIFYLLSHPYQNSLQDFTA